MGNKEFMRKAIELSVENVKNGGGPFGAVIVKGDEIVATGVNRVTAHNDPTAHAEVSAIREACRRLGTFDLSGCEIYTSCEPCPMCLGAIYWAHLDKIYYGNNKDDAADIGFDDSFIYEELALPRQTARKPWKNCCPKKPSQLSTCGATRQTRLNIKPLSFQSIAAGHPPPMENPKSSVTAFGFFTIFIRIKNFLIFFILLEKKCLILPM